MKRLIIVWILFTILNVFAEDMQKYLTDTEKLAQEGKNQEALTRFIWFYDHVLEYDPGFSAVRLSYLLAYWKELGNKYPPALNALQEVRNREIELIKSGKGTYETFYEVISINKYLMEDEKSIELFEFIDNKYPELAKECWDYIGSEIIAAKKFDLIRKYEPNLMKKFKEIVFTYKSNVLRYETSGDVENYKKINENDFVRETLELICATEAIDKKMAGCAYKIM